MRKGVKSQCLPDFKVSESLSILMLKLADDTIFLCDGKENSIWCLNAILRGFEMVSGLKVNFAKSNVVGINIEERVLRGVCHFLACNIGSIPFKFLGVPVCSNPNKEHVAAHH